MNNLDQVNTRDSDLFVASYPRSGNYWLRFMLGTYLHDIDIDWNNFKQYCPMIYHLDGIQAHQLSNPRVFGVHNMYNKVPNSIYIHRDPRDVVISLYFYYLKRGHIDYGFNDFFDGFINEDISTFGCWHDNVNSWLSNADYILSYDNLQDNASKELEHILSYFNYKIDFKKINHSVYWCRFENMKKLEKKQNYLRYKSKKDIDFIRKGKSKQWKDFLSDKQKSLMLEDFGGIMERLGYI